MLVRPPNDWFHTNSAIYDARDDSLIVSAREHFVMKIDYETGAIRWVLGDPTKYWYQFSSLRAKALTLDSGGLYPIGQHALSALTQCEARMGTHVLQQQRQRDCNRTRVALPMQLGQKRQSADNGLKEGIKIVW